MNDQLNLEFFYGMKGEAILSNNMNVLEFCMQMGLIANEYKCPTCGCNMKLIARKDAVDKHEWTCRLYGSSSHHVKRSVRKDSWFGESKLSMIEILLMTEFFVYQRTNQDVCRELNISHQTVHDWRTFFRETCVDICVNESCVLGGVGKVVEILESKFGKRKFIRGRGVDAKWMFAGIERGTSKCFFRVAEIRDKRTLLDIIKVFILPGTTIISDCWNSYECLADEGFQQLSASHSLHFVEPKNETHTNSIEGTWAAIKRKLPNKTATNQFDSHLAEYIWRRNHSECGDLMRKFLESVVNVYTPPGVTVTVGTYS